MRHRNSVFHDLLKLVPWAAFDGLVGEHGSDEGTRSFTSRQHLTALLFAQLSGAGSLARDRGDDGEPSGPALSLRRGRAEALDLRRRQPRPRFPRLFRPVRSDAGRARPRLPPQDGRRRAADRFDRAQACGGRRGMGALLDLRLRRQERMSSTIRTSGGRSTTP